MIPWLAAVAWAAQPDLDAPVDGVPPLLAAPTEEVAPTEVPPLTWEEVPLGRTLADVLPPAPRRGLGAALGFTLASVTAAALAGTLRAARSRLLPVGVLPDALMAVEVVCRGATVLAGIGALVAVVPAGLVPALPWIAVAAALALGWSARDALPDLVAWAVVTTEGKVRPGTWVRGDGFAGRVEVIRPRVTWLVDGRAQRVAVPNRRLLDRPLYTDPSPWPEIEVALHLPPSDRDLREVLRQAVLLSPWLAPGASPEVGWDPADPTRWTLRVRLVDGRFEGRFAGTLPERVHELLSRE